MRRCALKNTFFAACFFSGPKRPTRCSDPGPALPARNQTQKWAPHVRVVTG